MSSSLWAAAVACKTREQMHAVEDEVGEITRRREAERDGIVAGWGEVEARRRAELTTRPGLSTYECTQFKDKASRYWDRFYKSNTDRFFKDRHYVSRLTRRLALRLALRPNTTLTDHTLIHRPPQLEREWGGALARGSQCRTLLCAGCGCGNAVVPLLQRNPELFIYATDFAPRAVGLLRSRIEGGKGEEGLQSRCDPFVSDITARPSPLSARLGSRKADAVLLL